MIKKLATLFFLTSFSVMADVNVITTGKIDNDVPQVITFEDINNRCDYYGKFIDIKDNGRLIKVTRRVCGNTVSSVDLLAQPISSNPSPLDPGTEWTLR
jgi:hypothetical protein